MLFQGWLGDKYRARAPFLAVNACLGLIGLGLLGFTKTNGVRYFGVFLATIAGNANVPCVSLVLLFAIL